MIAVSPGAQKHSPRPRQPLALGVDAHEGPVVVRLDDGGVHPGNPHHGPSSQTSTHVRLEIPRPPAYRVAVTHRKGIL